MEVKLKDKTMRESGYYWVKYANIWQPAQFCHLIDNEGYWFMLADDTTYQDSELQKIGEKISR